MHHCVCTVLRLRKTSTQQALEFLVKCFINSGWEKFRIIHIPFGRDEEIKIETDLAYGEEYKMYVFRREKNN